MLHGKTLDAWQQDVPILADMRACKPVFWSNPHKKPCVEAMSACEFTEHDVADAAARLQRFAPCISALFPETSERGGLIESPLHAAPALCQALRERPSSQHTEGGLNSLAGHLLLKLDSHLPVSGSIKSRGGIYEVLTVAETLAIRHGLLRLQDDYTILTGEKFRHFFSQYSLAVGSTGNLGLSIGLMGARLGFQVTVHMSADARQWKKDKLRAGGVQVMEYATDYSAAVAAGRNAAKADPRCHFVDDESSRDLFLGYAVAGQRLAAQLAEQELVVDAEHPLFVYLPCGVGGGPGGVTLGLKQIFGDAVHCLFAEPAQIPAVILGLATGLDDRVHCRDIGLDGLSAADGLAVGQPSGLVCRAMRHLLDACFTMSEDALFADLALVAETEHIQLEPSAVAGLSGLASVLARYPEARLPTATHIVWATGGSMVPQAEWQKYQQRGLSGLSGRG